MKKRKIAVITGTRAEFGVLITVIKAIKNNPKLNLHLIATGMHFQKKHGYTADDITRSGFNIDSKIKIIGESDRPIDIADSIASGIKKFSREFMKIKPDIVLVTRDRTEQLAATIAAAVLRIPIAHYVGGERTKGSIDESIRHSITKFANIHLVKTQESKNRVIKMGERPETIFVVGFSGLDYIQSQELYSRAELDRILNLDPKKSYVIVLQHPVTSEHSISGRQIEETLRAVDQISQQKIILYPNSDPGSEQIIRAIKKHASENPDVRLFRSLPYKAYLSLIKHSNMIIGNSSGPTVETIPFGIPVINIGIRQEGRERGSNFIDCSHDHKAILEAIRKAQTRGFRKKLQNIKNPFGTGESAKKIAQILSEIEITPELLKKKITY